MITTEETGTKDEVRPSLKVVGLHIEGLRALRRVDWPADGLGWGGQVPDMVIVGGVNGSGKTTLLEFIFGMIGSAAYGTFLSPLARLGRFQGWLDLQVRTAEIGEVIIQVRIEHSADQTFAMKDRRPGCLRFLLDPRGGYQIDGGAAWAKLQGLAAQPEEFTRSTLPSVVHFPSLRPLVIPDVKFKHGGKLRETNEFLFSYQRTTETDEWEDSIEALLYNARWLDLNAKEEGRPEDARHFESYLRAFQAFFGETKTLVWQEGELFVKVADTGKLHPLTELSSGEQQVLVIMAELRRRWRPGSLILIDEPELHFHQAWQTVLWEILSDWRRELGGQVIVATQSNHLFRISEPDSGVLLGGRTLG